MTSDVEMRSVVRGNLERVRDRIAAACDTAGRAIEGVRLVGVSKYVGPYPTAQLAVAGCRDLGESRPQQLWEKAETLALDGCEVRWRMIGHLQRNKVARTVPISDSIDSVDSRRLLKAIDQAADQAGKRQTVLLEVNCSGDAEKHGFSPAEVDAVLAERDTWPHVEIDGLMTMAAREGGPDIARQNFHDLRELRDKLRNTNGTKLDELSMGMSGDFEAAIAEGSTLVRIGSALWEGIARE
ncbi:MAG: YggS family pyridoxal phosphate-dependent enzyme [Planctomycetota bacterium]